MTLIIKIDLYLEGFNLSYLQDKFNYTIKNIQIDNINTYHDKYTHTFYTTFEENKPICIKIELTSNEKTIMHEFDLNLPSLYTDYTFYKFAYYDNIGFVGHELNIL